MENKSKYALRFIILILFLAKSVENQNTSQTFGANILVNPEFELPAMISPALITTYTSSILGWNCTQSCQLYNLQEECLQNFAFFCPLSIYHQVMNLQSTGIQNVTQLFPIDTNTTNFSYLLQFQWLPPQISPLSGKYVTVYLNSIALVNISINFSNCFSLSFFKYSTIVTLQTGNNQIKFVMGGSSDGFGIFIDNVSLQEIIITTQNSVQNITQNATQNVIQNITQNSTQSPNMNNSVQTETYFNNIVSTLLTSLTNNSYNKILNQLPGSRVFCSYLMNFYIDFDRLQFYYFHKQNFTQYASMLLDLIYTLQEDRGSLLQLLILSYTNESSLAQTIQGMDLSLRQTFSFKYNYSNSYFLSRQQNGDGFIENQMRFFYYQVPCILLLYIVLFMVFQLFFSYKISLSLRKYCFFGILLLLLFQGNVEQFTFYIVTELKCFFSGNFIHRLVNSFIVYFGFLLFFYIFGSLLFFYSYYKKYSKYFIEDCQRILCSFINVSIQSGIIPLISGVIHSLFLEDLLKETILLVLMEISCIIMRIQFLKRRIYVYRIRIFIHIFNNLLRIAFLTSLYWFSQGGDANTINNLHFYFIIGYVASWIFEILITLCIICARVATFAKKGLCMSNKVQNTKQTCMRSRKSKALKPKLVSFQVENCKSRVIGFMQGEHISKSHSIVEENLSTNTLKSKANLIKHPFTFRFLKNKILSLIEE